MHEIDYTSIGQKIKKARNEQKLSQEALAEKCDISTSFLGHIERGTRTMSLETLIKVSNSLNLSLDYLLHNNVEEATNSIASILERIKRENRKEDYNKLIRVIKILIDNIDRL